MPLGHYHVHTKESEWSGQPASQPASQPGKPAEAHHVCLLTWRFLSEHDAFVFGSLLLCPLSSRSYSSIQISFPLLLFNLFQISPFHFFSSCDSVDMSKAGAFDLASGLGGKIEKDDVLSAVDKYEKYHSDFGGAEEDRKANYTDMVNKYYDLVTSFYEYGWGESFHFAPRWKGESLRESIKRHEHFLALQLGLKPGDKVLDVGCGIGGPLREIARFSSTSVMGINNNEYQITRGKALNRVAGVDRTCDFTKADFMKMPFSDNSFDAVYAIEATCHAPDAVGCYKEIFRVLKPGQSFAAYEWCMTDAFDPHNQEHQKIKAEIEIGDGLPDIRSTRQCLAALKEAGFEVIWESDLAKDSPLPWYLPLDTSHFSLSSFRLTAVGRFITKNMVIGLEYVGLAPKGSQRVQSFLEKAADGLVAGGKKEIFTPMYFFLARKPQ